MYIHIYQFQDSTIGITYNNSNFLAFMTKKHKKMRAGFLRITDFAIDYQKTYSFGLR